MLLDNFRHWPQRHDDDCLIACCKMVLSHLGIEKNEEWLWQRLSLGAVTPFPNVEKLAEELGLTVEIGNSGTLTNFGPYIESGLPVIVAVDTDDLRDWPYVRNHAVVVVGFDDQTVFVHDPAQSGAPVEVDINTFLLAWSNRDYQYAIVGLERE